jgi:hypothetical protein
MMDQMEGETRIQESYDLFDKLECWSKDADGKYHRGTSLVSVDEDRMRCHILNCLAALSVVEMQRTKELEMIDNSNEKRELAKRKVFRAACKLMINTQFDNNDVAMTIILSSFPDDSKIDDKRSWLSMHFAIVLFAQNQISSEDVYLLHIVDPLFMYTLSEEEFHEVGGVYIGCTPAHLICMQKQPNMSMVKYFCLRDPKAFLLCDQSGRCTLHLAAQYSDSVELLQMILQIDQTMTKSLCKDDVMTPLGPLCRRLELTTFNEMFTCLIQVDSSDEIVYDGVIGCLESYISIQSMDHCIHPRSRGKERWLSSKVF